VQTARPEEKLARCEVKCCCPLPWRRSGSLRFPLAQRRQLESGGRGGVSWIFIFIFICAPKTWQEDVISRLHLLNPGFKDCRYCPHVEGLRSAVSAGQQAAGNSQGPGGPARGASQGGHAAAAYLSVASELGALPLPRCGNWEGDACRQGQRQGNSIRDRTSIVE
jgi:hypothetical protein